MGSINLCDEQCAWYICNDILHDIFAWYTCMFVQWCNDMGNNPREEDIISDMNLTELDFYDQTTDIIYIIMY